MILLIGMLVIFIALQIRILQLKIIFNKLIKDDMTSGNYDNAQNIVKQTINKIMPMIKHII